MAGRGVAVCAAAESGAAAVCDLTSSDVRHDSFIGMTRLALPGRVKDSFCPYVGHDSFICVT